MKCLLMRHLNLTKIPSSVYGDASFNRTTTSASNQYTSEVDIPNNECFVVGFLATSDTGGGGDYLTIQGYDNSS